MKEIQCWLLLSLAAVVTANASSVTRLSDIKGAGLLFEPDEHNIVHPAPMVSSLVDLNVSGMVARGRVQQFFYNPSEQTQSGFYVFPLPESAAVDGFRIRIGNRSMEGQIAERRQAEATFEQARRDGAHASLLSQERLDIFTIAVANVGPGEEIEVELELQFEVRFEVDRFRLRFPLLAAKRYDPGSGGCRSTNSSVALASHPAPNLPPTLPAGLERANPVALRVDLHPGGPLSSVTSPTHAITVQEHRRLHQSVELSQGLAPANGDFVLEWTPVADHLPRVSLTVEQHGDATYGLLMVMPPTASGEVRLAREVIFVVDTSGSMEGIAIQQAREALILALLDLQPLDRFNLIQFSSGAKRLFPQAVAAQPESISQAKAWVAALSTGGGTNMPAALAAALDVSSEIDDGLLRQVIFVTDGRVSHEPQMLSYLRDHLGDSRLFTVGLGSAPNGSFIRRAAEFGRGTSTLISDVHETRRRMTALLHKLTSPVLGDLNLWWDDPTAQTWPKRPGDLYVGEPLVLVTRFKDPRGQVHLSGQIRGMPWNLDLPLFDATDNSITTGRGIAKLWARRQSTALIDVLTSSRIADSNEVQEMRQQVVELALEHRLVTPYTSFVAVDVTAGAPPEIMAPMRPIPLLSPRELLAAVANTTTSTSGVIDSTPTTQVTEELVVTSQMPLVDTKTSCSASMTPIIDLELLPTANKPWSLVSAAPGVLVDRPLVNGAATPPAFSGRGTANHQAVIRLDEFEITDDTDSEPAFELRGVPLEEVKVTSGSGDSTLSTAGLKIDLMPSVAGNTWQGDGRVSGSRSDSANEGDRVRRFSTASLETGGPLRRDQMWALGAVSDTATERQVTGGQRADSDLLHATGKLQTAFGGNSVNLSWHRGEASENGRGAGPDRAPDATWNHRGQAELWHLLGVYIPSPSLYLSGGSGRLERQLDDLPRGGFGATAFTDLSGVTDGSTFGRSSGRRTREHRLGGNAFFGLSPLSYELEIGARERRHETDTSWLTGLGQAVEAGQNLGLPAGLALLTDGRDTNEHRNLDQLGVWFQNELTGQRLTLFLGLRYDQQEGTSQTSAGDLINTTAADWQNVTPRLGLTLGLGASQRSVLRAAYGRFASRLGPMLSRRLGSGGPIVDSHLLEDNDGDLVYDLDEPIQPWLSRRPDRFSPDLAPELTDEALLSVEHEFGIGLAAGLTVTHRRTWDVLERRTLVRSTGVDNPGEVFQATADDWVESGTLEGQLPDGSIYQAPFFDLRSGLERFPSGLWVNGDRQHESLLASLTLRGRLSHRVWLNGHLNWSDRQWRLGQEFLRFDDPTDAAGSADDQGDRAVDSVPRGLQSSTQPVDSRWSFHLSTVVKLPWSLDLGMVVDGREGYPLPYTRRIFRTAAGLANVELTDRVDAYRAEDIVTLDIRLAKKFEIGAFDLSLSLEAFNLLGAGGVLRRELDLGVGRGGAVDEELAPRSVRLGIRVGWR